MTTPIVKLAKLPADGPHRVSWETTSEDRAAMAARLDLQDLRKLRADVTLTPHGKRDWRLSAKWGATVVQSCVVSLAPVVTRLDREDTLLFTAKMPKISESEAEMPEDETLEPLRDEVALEDVLTEMISLALPAYPRAEGAELGDAVFAEPGVKAMTDEDAKPFAGLAGLKAKLDGGE